MNTAPTKEAVLHGLHDALGVMSSLPVLQGYNGTRLLMDDIEARNIRSDLLAGIEFIEGELQALQKDAERYNWLANSYYSPRSAYQEIGPSSDKESLGAAIDAAIAASKEETK